MYNRRVAKAHPRVEAYGTVDELNAALGLARALASSDWLKQNLHRVQKDLVVVMGELATQMDDLGRYAKDGFSTTKPEMTRGLEQIVKEVEAQQVSFEGWATPGANPSSATLDVARTTCRRAERCVCRLQEGRELANPEIIIYLNRLSDTLWLLARWVETKVDSEPV